MAPLEIPQRFVEVGRQESLILASLTCGGKGLGEGDPHFGCRISAPCKHLRLPSWGLFDIGDAAVDSAALPWDFSTGDSKHWPPCDAPPQRIIRDVGRF